MEPIVEKKPQPVRFDGKFRSDEYGIVEAREANRLNAFVRLGWNNDRHGEGVSEGSLAGLMRVKKEDEAFKICLQRLLTWGYIELYPAVRGDARRIKVTSLGQQLAVELRGELQVAKKPVDTFEE
jgi:hypothetical protein